MNKLIPLLLLFVFFFVSCKKFTDDRIPFDLKKHPGMAIIGNDEVTVFYSDDARIFDDNHPPTGGIKNFYFRDSTINYIRGSLLEILDEHGNRIGHADTFGLDPFYSPFQIIRNGSFNARTQAFVTEDGITALRLYLNANENLNLFIRWSAYTPVELDLTKIIRTDRTMDGIYHRYNNNLILAFSATGDYNQYHFDETENILTITTPLSIRSGQDTTHTYFIVGGYSDTEVISKMFLTEETDLFHNTDGYWNSWLLKEDKATISRSEYRKYYYSNRYALYASKLNDNFPGYRILPDNDDQIEEVGFEGDPDPDRVLRELIENSNSYGLMTGRKHSLSENDYNIPISIRKSRYFIQLFEEIR